jgi:uncharacterized protein
MRIGVISDTHGEVPGAALEAFAGVDRILCAGDIGTYEALLELSEIAPVTAVAGNTDRYSLGVDLPPTANVELGGVRVLVVHDARNVPRPLPPGVRVVVSGHTHVASVAERDGVLWLNPGSASRPRSGDDPSVAILTIGDAEPSVRILPLR